MTKGQCIDCGHVFKPEDGKYWKTANICTDCRIKNAFEGILADPDFSEQAKSIARKTIRILTQKKKK